MNPLNMLQQVGSFAQLMQQLPMLKQQLMQQGVNDPKTAAMKMMQSGRFNQGQLDFIQSFARQAGIKF